MDFLWAASQIGQGLLPQGGVLLARQDRQSPNLATVRNPDGHLWRDNWTALSGSFSLFFIRKRDSCLDNREQHGRRIRCLPYLANCEFRGRGPTRAEDVQGTSTQSHTSPSELVHEEKKQRSCWANYLAATVSLLVWISRRDYGCLAQQWIICAPESCGWTVFRLHRCLLGGLRCSETRQKDVLALLDSSHQKSRMCPEW